MASFELGCLTQPRLGECDHCGVTTSSLCLCPCAKARYCSQECQQQQWDIHQADCQYGLDSAEVQVCSACLSTATTHLSCSCGTTFYCNSVCQARHYKEHQHVCKARIRVLLREAQRSMVHVGVQCRRRHHRTTVKTSKVNNNTNTNHDGGDITGPVVVLGTEVKSTTATLPDNIRAVDFDDFDKDDDDDEDTTKKKKDQQSNGNGDDAVKKTVSFRPTPQQREVVMESDGSSSSSGEDVDIVDHGHDMKRTASTIAKAFIKNVTKMTGEKKQASSGTFPSPSTVGFGGDGEVDDGHGDEDDEDEEEGGCHTQPKLKKKKIPVAVYLDLDEVKCAKKLWTTMGGHGSQQARKIVRRGVIMA